MQTQTHAFFILFILILIQSIKSQETQCDDARHLDINGRHGCHITMDLCHVGR